MGFVAPAQPLVGAEAERVARQAAREGRGGEGGLEDVTDLLEGDEADRAAAKLVVGNKVDGTGGPRPEQRSLLLGIEPGPRR